MKTCLAPKQVKSPRESYQRKMGTNIEVYSLIKVDIFALLLLMSFTVVGDFIRANSLDGFCGW